MQHYSSDFNKFSEISCTRVSGRRKAIKKMVRILSWGQILAPTNFQVQHRTDSSKKRKRDAFQICYLFESWHRFQNGITHSETSYLFGCAVRGFCLLIN